MNYSKTFQIRVKALVSMALAGLLSAAAPALADDEDSKSQFRVMPYLWAAQFDGTVGAATDGGDGPIDVDVGFDELCSPAR